jgi:TPR repeat protein
MMKKYVLVVMLALCAAPVWADLAKAEQGDADAQFELGGMYIEEEDYTQSAKWLRKAAEQGHAKAQYNLGLMYANGKGVPQDYSQTANWFRKAAEQDHAEA